MIDQPILSRARALIIDHDNQCALFMHRIKNGQEYYTLCGGKLEQGETPEDGCLREIFEETSLTVELLHQAFYAEDMHDGILNRHYVFFCRYQGGTAKLNGEERDRISDTNHYQPVWIPVNAISDLEIKPDIIAEKLRAYLSKNDLLSQ